MSSLLTIENLNVGVEQAETPLVHDINLDVEEGEVLGIIGESGSGKTLTVRSLMGVLPPNLESRYGHYTFAGADVDDPFALPIAMIFQDPLTSLNPLMTIQTHLAEVVRRFQTKDKAAIREKSIAMLGKVGMPDPEATLRKYPNELSGGMRQRVMIAMALLTNSRLLIADEPTSALDVTIQKQILRLIKQVQEEQQLTVIMVSHDFGVIAGMADHIAVMKSGTLVERGTTADLFAHPEHPYTKELLQAAAFDMEGDESHG